MTDLYTVDVFSQLGVIVAVLGGVPALMRFVFWSINA